MLPSGIHRHHPAQTHASIRSTVWSHWRLARAGRRLSQAYRDLGSSARWLVATHLANVAKAYLSVMFVSVYLWRQANDFRLPAVFYFTTYLMLALVFWLMAILPWRPRAKRIMQLGLAIYALQYIVLMLYGVSSFWQAAAIGMIGGLGAGFFWSGNHVLTYSETAKAGRDQYYGLITAVGYVLSVVVPAIGGFIIAQQWFRPLADGLTGEYTGLFLLTIAVILVGILFAHRIDDLRFQSGQAKPVLKLLRQKRWRFLAVREFLDGIMTGPINIIGVILAFTILGGSELNLGIYSSVFALLGAVGSILIGGLMGNRESTRVLIGFIGALLMTVSAIIYAGLFSFAGIVISSVLDVAAGPLFAVGMGATFYHAIDRSPRQHGGYYAYILLRETVLTVGRLFSIALFMWTLAWAEPMIVARFWYAGLFLIPLLFVLLTRWADRTEPAPEGELRPGHQLD
jgi:YQGE family putative transporter